MDTLQNKKYNVSFILLIAALSFFLYHQSGILEDAGMAVIILNWLPLLIGIGTIIFYLIASVLFNRQAWIVTALGCLFNIILVISAFVQA